MNDPWFSLPINNIKRAKSALEHGNLRKAAQALQSNGVHQGTREIIKILEEKHPWDEPIPIVESTVKRTRLFANPDVQRAIETFPNASAPGPDGFRASYLKDLITLPGSSSFLSVLTSFFNIMGTGSFPTILAPFYSAATLIPVKKKDNGVRPVGVPNVDHRTVSKLHFKKSCKEATRALSPYQLGVGVNSAVEAIPHAVQNLINNFEPNHSVLTLDFNNAFNSLSRPPMLKAIFESSPLVHDFASWTYSQHSYLFIQGKIIMSCKGVRQGDPLGPYYFALALQELVKAINLRFAESLKVHVWYLDDGTIICPSEIVSDVYSFIVHFIPSLGLELNASKCNVFAPTYQSEWNDLPEELQKSIDGITLLGTPVGSQSYIHNVVDKKVKNIITAIDLLPELNDPQAELCLLRACFGNSKIAHLTHPSLKLSTD